MGRGGGGARERRAYAGTRRQKLRRFTETLRSACTGDWGAPATGRTNSLLPRPQRLTLLHRTLGLNLGFRIASHRPGSHGWQPAPRARSRPSRPVHYRLPARSSAALPSFAFLSNRNFHRRVHDDAALLVSLSGHS